MTKGCDCEVRRDPLASFCGDDLFCPQCGTRVAWLTSKNELPNPDPVQFRNAGRLLWVYAESIGGRRFSFPIAYHALNESRAEKERKLEVCEARCAVQPFDSPYTFSLKADHGDGPHHLWLRLEPDPRLAEQYGPNWATDEGLMPAGGIFAALTLVGNFGTERFSLLIFGQRMPQIEVHQPDGHPILELLPDGSEPGDHAWPISRRGRHRLSVSVAYSKGFVHLHRGDDGRPQAPGVRPPRGIKLDDYETSHPPDGILGPGREPCRIMLEFDSERWTQGELVRFEVDLNCDVLGDETIPIPLYLEPRGDVGFQPPQLSVPPMYYGECERSQPDGVGSPIHLANVQVFNRGERPLKLSRPTVEPAIDGPAGVEWIRVNWVDRDREKDGQLAEDTTLELEVTIDLSRVSSRNHPPGRPLSATILIETEEEERSWELPVVIQSVSVRPPLDSPVAIDFGNTNTYAVVVRDDAPGSDSVLRAVLGGDDPEHFPTAMFLNDVIEPAASNVVIGPEAVALGRENPGRMVRALKRWLLADEAEWNAPWTVIVPGRSPRELKRSDLIRVFLERVIFECEVVERRTVTRVGFSYPANFSPRARQRFDRIVEELEVRHAARNHHLEETAPGTIRFERVATVDSTPDEASAVAVEFVHDERRYAAEIAPRLEEGAGGSFFVASYDFGGGSIDSALLRFTKAGNPDWLQFASEHLSLGGDEAFGGDNVTTAVGLIVLDRFRGLLRRVDAAAVFPVAAAHERAAPGTVRWDNFEQLRMLAEELKRHLCRPAGAVGEAGGPGASTGSSAAAAAGPPPRAGESTGLDRLDSAIPEFLNRIKVQGAAQGLPAPRADVAALREPLREALLRITLDEVYRCPIPLAREEDPQYTVRERVERSLAELHGFVQEARNSSGRDEPLFIVLAGAACRLPLVRELIRLKFGDAAVFGDPLLDPRTRPKSKVAFGLARFLDYQHHSPATVEKLSRAGHYTHGPIVWKGGAGMFKEWVPTCSPLNAGDRWHTLKIGLHACLRRGRLIDVYHQAFRPELIGSFDLSVPATEIGEGRDASLPVRIEGGVPSEVLLKVGTSEGDLRLRVRYGQNEDGTWREYGDWQLRENGRTS